VLFANKVAGGLALSMVARVFQNKNKARNGKLGRILKRMGATPYLI
jgi:hypothetical protein